MAKRNYIPWSPSEEKRLISWVKHHPELSWEARAEKYSTEPGHRERTAESMRSKYRQLCRGIQRQRQIHGRFSTQRFTQQARPQRRRYLGNDIFMVVPPPPTLTVKARSSKMQAVIKQTKQRHPSHRGQPHWNHISTVHPKPVTVSPEHRIKNESRNASRLPSVHQGGLSKCDAPKCKVLEMTVLEAR